MEVAKAGLLIDRTSAERRWTHGIDVFEQYYAEVLSQAGIPFVYLEDAASLSASGLDILIVGLEPDDDFALSPVWRFAEAGGTVISCGGLLSWAKRLGCTPGRSVGPGYAEVGAERIALGKLRYLRASPWTIDEEANGRIKAAGALHELRPDGGRIGPYMLQFAIGQGFVVRVAVRIAETIVGLQQGGSPVFRDGVPAPDGTGDLQDGILKADDVIEMDWDLDRSVTETGNPYFSTPYADLWREAFVAVLLQASTALKGRTLPFLDEWPDGIAQVAMISHDSDANEDAAAETTLDVLKEAQVRSTWCMIEPGYSSAVYEQVIRDGHELALHYNAMASDNRPWSGDEFRRQAEWFRKATGLTDIHSNKNHVTRFEGWGDLFEWCEANGVSSDQTRGPSKKGNTGFLFGTCHPYYPISRWNRRNRLYGVLEIGFLTQDMDHGKWADSSVIVPFLTQVRRVRGVAQFLFHQYHLHRLAEVRAAFHSCVEMAREMGFSFWTGRQIVQWTRARRNAELAGLDPSLNPRLRGLEPGYDYTVWIPIPAVGEPLDEPAETRYGVACVRRVVRAGSEGTANMNFKER